MKRIGFALLVIIIAFSIGVTITLITGAGVKESEKQSAEPKPTHEIIDQAALLTALSETPELVGLTGEITKEITADSDKWYGNKTYSLTLEGTFKLGVPADEIRFQITGNDVIITLPPVELIALELPFNDAVIAKDIGLLRKNVSEAELQALYGAGRAKVVEDILADEQAQSKAEKAVRHALSDLLSEVGGVDRVIFTNEDEE